MKYYINNITIIRPLGPKLYMLYGIYGRNEDIKDALTFNTHNEAQAYIKKHLSKGFRRFEVVSETEVILNAMGVK